MKFPRFRQGRPRPRTGVAPFSGLALAASFLALSLASAAAARPSIFEYWKAGTHTNKSSGSRTPRKSPSAESGPRTVRAAEAASVARPSRPSAWTAAWFSDRDLVRRQLVAMEEAISVPMIGERYPLPRGGGFRCTQAQSDPSQISGAATWVLRCQGPDIGGERENDFYMPAPGIAPVLERVRWVIRPPARTPLASWRVFYRELADSLSRTMGPPTWSGPDSVAARWVWNHCQTTIRLHFHAAGVESLEVACASDRLRESGP